MPSTICKISVVEVSHLGNLSYSKVELPSLELCCVTRVRLKWTLGLDVLQNSKIVHR